MNKTLMVSSHLLGEMELIADSILVINKGKKVVEGERDELLNPEKIQVELVTDNKENALAILKGTSWSHCLVSTTSEAILLEMSRKNIPELNRLMVEKQVNVISLRPKHSLEDFFLSLTRN
jgi:ABC-type multidrug transport system ATPase subunit